MFRLTAVAATALILIFGNFAAAQSIYRLPAGTQFKLKLENEVNSLSASVGDTFTARTAQPVRIDGIVVLPEGTRFEARVTRVVRSGIGRRDGKLEAVFQSVYLAGRTRPTVGAISDAVDSLTRFNPLPPLAGAGAGAAIGGIARGGRGSIIGAAAGAGTGMLISLLKKGREVRWLRGNELGITLKEDLMLPVAEY